MMPVGQVRRPVAMQRLKLPPGPFRETGGNAIRLRLGLRKKRLPAIQRQRIRSGHREVAAIEVQLRQGRSESRAMLRARPTNSESVEKGEQGSGPAGKSPKRFRTTVLDRKRAVQAFGGEMLHQAEKERQVGLVHPLLVEREDKRALRGVEIIVGVLDAFGDAFAG